MLLVRPLFFALAWTLLGWGLMAPPAAAQGRQTKYIEIGVTMANPKGYQGIPIPRSAPMHKLLFVRRDGDSEEPINWSLFRVDHERFGTLSPSAFSVSVLGARPSAPPKRVSGGGHFSQMRWEYERSGRRGLVFAYTAKPFSYYLVGEAPGAKYDDEARIWRRWAGDVRFHTPKDNERERAALHRRYAGTRFSDPERRIAARLSLVPGWKGYDGEKYIYLVHGLDSQTWKSFDRELLGVRRYLVDRLLSHANQEPTDVGVLRLCKDRNEYLDFGGWAEALGYFSPLDDELVVYNPGDLPAMSAVMRHEAFHQFIYSALGGMAPHIWFDEGFGEHMAGAEVGGRRVVGFTPLVHHQQTLAAMVAEGGPGLIPMQKFMSLTRDEFYQDPRTNYAQAWAWIEFLLRSDYGMRSKRGEDFCKAYIRELREGWTARLINASNGNPVTVDTMAEVRAAAQESALKKFDLEKAERAFLRFVKAQVAFLPR